MERGNETKRRRRHSLASSSPGREALATPATGQDRRLSSILSEKKDELFSASENAFLARGLPPGPTSRSFNRSSSFSSIIECPPYLESDDPNGEPLDWRSVLLQLRQDVDGLPIPLSKHHPRVTLGVEPDTDENSDNTNIDGGSATEHDAQAKDSSAIEGADEDRHQNDEEEEDEDRLVPVPPIALPAPPRRSALKKGRGRYRRTHIRFASEADVYDMEQSYYPNPASPRDYHPESRQVPPPPPTTLQQQRDTRVKLRELIQKHQPLTYGNLLRLAIGQFCMSEDLPPYVEDFINWVGKKRWVDPVTGETVKLSWVDRRWLKPIVEDTWGVQIKYFPTICL